MLLLQHVRFELQSVAQARVITKYKMTRGAQPTAGGYS